MTSALQHLNTVWLQFNQPDGEIQIELPQELNLKLENLKKTCNELLEAGKQWPNKIKQSLSAWMEIKASTEALNYWIDTAENDLDSIQNIPKFLMKFSDLEGKFQVRMYVCRCLL